MSLGYPIYVTGIDAEKNTVTLGGMVEWLRKTVVAREVNWIVGEGGGPREAVRYMLEATAHREP